jgi:hypothetical protein
MLINVTPVGMDGGPEAGQLAYETEVIVAADIVFDVVAIPSETPLIVRGRAEGKQVITGLEVIALQALEQFVLIPVCGRRMSNFSKRWRLRAVEGLLPALKPDQGGIHASPILNLNQVELEPARSLGAHR